MTKKEIDKEMARALEHIKAAELEVNAAREIVMECAEQQREAFDNIPEGLQSSERGQTSEARADALDEFDEALSDIASTLESMTLEVE